MIRSEAPSIRKSALAEKSAIMRFCSAVIAVAKTAREAGWQGKSPGEARMKHQIKYTVPGTVD